jgi:hypothetical protein
LICLNIFLKLLARNKLSVIVLICFILSLFNYISINNFKRDTKIKCSNSQSVTFNNKIKKIHKKSINNTTSILKTSTFVTAHSNDNTNRLISSHIKFPHILDTIPHLANRSTDSFLPSYQLTRFRNSKYVIGIPTVKREEAYIEKMLSSLFESFKKKQDDLNQILIVIQISELNDTNFINQTIKTIHCLMFVYWMIKTII